MSGTPLVVYCVVGSFSGSETFMSSGPIRLLVLVVDDERVIADTLALILRTRGHDAHAVYDAEAAIAAAAELDPDALISDVVMPGMNGIELTSYFADHFPQCKVLLMSGNAATTGLLEDARRHGYFVEFLPKPLLSEDVLRFLSTCGSRYET
ncbi:MAG TPA: response regulator [Terracidiphilus sp.]